jgi:ATP phosphoribosyltransferase
LVGHPLSMRLDDGVLTEIVTAIRTVETSKGEG